MSNDHFGGRGGPSDAPSRYGTRLPGRHVLSKVLTCAAVTAATTLGGSVALAASATAEEPWGFEQVTPPVKGEGTVGAVDGFRASQDANQILYTAKTPFSSVPTESSPLMVRYLGTRGDAGWTSRGVDPPMGVPGWNHIVGAVASSENLRYVLVGSNVALTPGATPGGGNLYIRDTSTGAYTLVATSPNRRLADGATEPFGQTGFPYVSNDGRSALFNTTTELDPELPNGGLFVWRAGVGLQVASVLPDGSKLAANTVGTAETGARDPMPRDLDALDHIYFGLFEHPVYVRTGNRTRVVSYSRIPGDPDTPVTASVLAVGAGGKTAVIETSTPLTTDADPSVLTDETGRFIYLYRHADDSLTYVGPGELYNSVHHMTRDARTIVFSNTIALRPGAEAGRRNFYMWRSGTIHFIATTEAGSTGSDNGALLRLLSPNGRYFAFTDNAPAAARRFGVEDNVSSNCRPAYSLDPGPCDQVYVFDAETDSLACASCAPDGASPTGHSGDPWGPGPSSNGFARGDQRQPQTVADDGTVFFTSGTDLLPQDRNYLDDVYAYRHGRLRLLSRGTAGARSRFLDATRDGSAVFFSTDDRIVSTDVDRSVDIYMTRAGAGYQDGTSQQPPAECAGGDCREPAGSRQPDVIAGTVTFAGPGNPDLKSGTVTPGRPVSVSKPRTVRGVRAVLRVSVRAPGRIVTSGGALRRSAVDARRAGTHRVAVRLSKIGKGRLQSRGRLKVRVIVRFQPAAGSAQTVRVPVTFVAPAPRKGR